MLWADELPQQFQSGTSIRRMPIFRQHSMSDWLFSLAVVASEQPGKYDSSVMGAKDMAIP